MGNSINTKECLECGAICCTYPKGVRNLNKGKQRTFTLKEFDGVERWVCDFLTEDRLCSVYKTRPTTCEVFLVGGSHCNFLRETEKELQKKLKKEKEKNDS